MSKDKPNESVKINLDDLQEHASRSTGNPPPKITNWLSLSSQLHAEGLQAFRAALNSPSVTDSPDGIKNLKGKHLKGLLEDLEKLSKRQEIDIKTQRGFPKFNSEFYNEVNKSEKDRSPEFKEFLKKYSELLVEGHFIEKASAQMLIDVGKPGASVEGLRNGLESHLKDYKQKYAGQTKLDIGARELILLKDGAGEIRAITMEELASSKTIPLTGEQRDFIKSTWQQGSFGGGWFSASTFQHNEAQSKMTTFIQNSLLIDMSTKDKIQVVNQVMSGWKSDSSPKTFGPCATATLSVDITGLKGSEFTPGCASVKPNIEVIVSKYDRDIDFIPDKLKKTSSSKLESSRESIEEDFRKGYYNTAKSKDEKLAAMALVKISKDDPIRYKIEVEKFQSKEKDSVKVEKFAGEQIDIFSQKQTAILDRTEKNRIKDGLVTILEPLCKNEQDKKALKDNVGKLIRECASDAGKDMSWSQSWNNYTDKAKRTVFKLLGREDKVEKLVNKYPNIVEALKKNMTPQSNERHNIPQRPKMK